MKNNSDSLAKVWKVVAEIYKTIKIRRFYFSYQQAVDLFEAEDLPVQACSCYIKIAELSAEQENYVKAIEIYEKVSNKSLDNIGMKWSIKNYLFKAFLCQFMLSTKSKDEEMTIIEESIQKYMNILNAVPINDTKELTLIQNCVQAVKQKDVDKFAEQVYKYDEMYKLDSWSLKILSKVKATII